MAPVSEFESPKLYIAGKSHLCRPPPSPHTNAGSPIKATTKSTNTHVSLTESMVVILVDSHLSLTFSTRVSGRFCSFLSCHFTCYLLESRTNSGPWKHFVMWDTTACLLFLKHVFQQGLIVNSNDRYKINFINFSFPQSTVLFSLKLLLTSLFYYTLIIICYFNSYNKIL
jgi:hypothetical protein